MYFAELFLLRKKDNKWYLTTYDRTNDYEKIRVLSIILLMILNQNAIALLHKKFLI
ncbi:hypothetical protein CNEO_250083 [Clostridium neonatale]|nr:hypothetical protein CNEO_250083 [Clostridium neonatale]